MNSEKQEQETRKKTILSHGYIFSISIWVYINILRHPTHKVYCVQDKNLFYVGVVVKNLLVFYMSWPETC